MKTTWVKNISVAVPYVAVLVGLYVLESAWIALGIYHLGIAGFLIAGDRGMVLAKAWRGWNLAIAAGMVVMSAMVFPAVLLLWGKMQLADAPLSVGLASVGLQGRSWLGLMVYFSTVQPVLEELYWRGYMESRHKCIAWTDFAFAGYHLLALVRFVKAPWLLVALVVLTLAAWVWRYVAGRLGGLIVPLLSHIVADMSIVAVTYILIR